MADFPVKGSQPWDTALKQYIDAVTADLRRQSVLVAMFGQSNEAGSVPVAQTSTFPQAFKSKYKQAVRTPVSPRINTGGGYLIKVHDDLYEAGYAPQIVNGAIGGISLIKDAAGFMGAWAANSPFYGRRPSAGPGDRGYAGDLIQVGGGVWRCIRGDDKFATGNGPDLTATPGRGDGFLDSLTTHAGVRAPGSVPTQNITVTGAPAGGTFTLNGNSATTAAIPYNATAATVQTALQALGGVFSACSVTGNAGGAWQVVLNPGTITPSPLTLGTNSLTGGTAPTVTVAPFAFANYRTGPTSPFPSDATLSAYPRGYVITEVPASSANPGVQWRFEGFVNGTPPNGIGGQGTWPLAAAVFTSVHSGMGFDPLGLLNRLHEEMQRRTTDRKIVYLANGQSDLGFASTVANTMCTTYRDALLSIAYFFLSRGYEVVLGFTNYSPAASGTINQWNNLVLARDAALAVLEADATVADRVGTGANLYAAMGTTGPMAAGGAFLEPDNTHLNGRGAVGDSFDVGGGTMIHCAAKYVSDALKTVLASPPALVA